MKSINGFLIFDSPVYRGNATKTLFTRGNSKEEITLPGRIEGSAKAMMSAFTGFWEHPKNSANNNYGLLERLWQRLYNESMPNVVRDVSCTLEKQSSGDQTYFDMRMGIAIDRDSMTQAKDQNFRLETVYKGSRFNFTLNFDENKLNQENQAKFAYLIEEMVQGRFWFGAQKSKGMGQCYLKLDQSSRDLIDKYKNNSRASPDKSANYIFIHLHIRPDNPLLVSWPWGNKDEKDNRDTWVDELVNETNDHKNIMSSVLSDKAKSWDDIKQIPGGNKFEQSHWDRKKNQPMGLGQLKKNFSKGIQNDDTLMEFLKGHRERAHNEIDREAHQDFREEEGAVIRGKPYDQLFYRSLYWNGDQSKWELCIPGNTIKGALRNKAQQILRTLHNGKGCKEQTSSHDEKFCEDKNCPVCSLFGKQGKIASFSCSDAYLETSDKLLDDKHYSYDQIAVDKKTGQSIENSKLNYLYAYGEDFTFKCTITLKDIDIKDFQQLGFLFHLLKEFEQGTIPLGGKKALNFGYVRGAIDKMEVLCAPDSTLEKQLKKWKVKKTGVKELWHQYEVNGRELWNNNKFTQEMQRNFDKLIGEIQVPAKPFKTKQNYISHRQYSELCGTLECELEAITPLHIKESGEPSIQDVVPGYDFFSIFPPKNSEKYPIGEREYAIPPSTLKGETRKIYNLISQDPCNNCSKINSLCDTCSLFGWVGKDSGQALMGRLKFDFARLAEDQGFEWYGVKFGYKGEKSYSVAGNRIFPHNNKDNESVIRFGNSKEPKDVVKNITLNRFAKPGSKFEFQVSFTNLQEQELQKLIWSLELEDGLGHKIGKSKVLYFGSCKIRIKNAYLIDWKERFSSFEESGETNLDISKYRPNKEDLANYNELKKALSLPNSIINA